jgi:two-component system KDP operon response regulator KdpE
MRQESERPNPDTLLAYAQAEEQQQTRRAMSNPASEAVGGVRVLVVDDERAIRRLLQVSLTAHGHTVFEATRGQEALEAVVNYRPDIIILDLGLPDIEGVEVTRRLREWTQTPIIILSVRDQETDKIAALDAGADDYLTKPFSMGELLARLRVALRHATPYAAWKLA